MLRIQKWDQDFERKEEEEEEQQKKRRKREAPKPLSPRETGELKNSN